MRSASFTLSFSRMASLMIGSCAGVASFLAYLMAVGCSKADNGFRGIGRFRDVIFLKDCTAITVPPLTLWIPGPILRIPGEADHDSGLMAISF